MAKRRTTKKQTEDGPKWVEVPGVESNSSVYVQHDGAFLFIAGDAFGKADVYKMVLLDDAQTAWLHAALGKHLAAKAART